MERDEEVSPQGDGGFRQKIRHGLRELPEFLVFAVKFILLLGICLALTYAFMDFWKAEVVAPTSVGSAGQCKAIRATGAKECKLKLKDGRTVVCVDMEHGTSCDWAHATTRKGR